MPPLPPRQCGRRLLKRTRHGQDDETQAGDDRDETLPAPWEWDVKRLAASFVVACRDNKLSDAVARDVAMTCVRS